MLKAVLFDIGNVLIKWPQEAVYADIQQELQLDDAQFSLFRKKYLYKLGLGEITEERLWSDVAREFNIRKISVDENLLSRTFEAEGAVFEDVLACARTLKERGFKIALLSNTVSVHERVVTSKGIAEPFDYMFLSHRIGLRKPNAKIYMHALAQLHVEPSEALFIDDLKENVNAAQKLGMCTVLADNPNTIVQKIERELEDDFVGSKAALIFKGKVLTILRDRKEGIPFPGYWDFPGGAREDNETPIEVAIREIREELSIRLTPKEFVWQKFYPGVVDKRQTACFLVAELTDSQVHSIVFGDEGQKWRFMAYQGFLRHPKAVGA